VPLFCPNCSSENSQEQRFCRKCGLHLQTIAQVVAHQVNARQSQPAWSKLAEPKTILQNPLFYAFLLVLLGICVSAVGKRIGEQGIADVGTILSFIGVAFFVLAGIFMFQRLRSNGSGAEVPKVDTTRELPHLLEAKEPLSSITEFTTRTFDPVYAERYDSETPNTRRQSDSAAIRKL
jgi:hypothetical protein